MWLFTKYGFYSAVCARKGDGSHTQPADPERIMVRARVRDHLEALKERFSDVLANCEIKEFPGADYAFRIFIPKSSWSRLLVDLAEEIDYDNFKNEVAHHQGSQGKEYESSLHKVWETMNQLQKGT